MQLIRGLHNLKNLRSNHCVATIGNFDGMHIGHQRVLQDLKQHAARLKLPSTVILFEPQPQEYFRAEQAPARLLRLREKLMFLQAYGIDQVLCLYFNAALAELSAEDFVKQILLEKLGVRFLLIGDDFRFGKQRQGDFALLQQLATQYNFAVANTQTVTLDGKRVGSSRVRDALNSGDLSHAAQLMGHPYVMTGHVVRGDRRGTDILGFPTANILLQRKVVPLSGVFIVNVHGLASKPLPGVANIGTRPTIDGKNKLLEIHLFDFNQTIYGRFLQVEFLHKLREEQHFASLDLLKKQIGKDVNAARNWIDTHESIKFKA